jgi:hypothetical protein
MTCGWWTSPARPDLSITPNAYKVIYCSGKSSMQVDNTEVASVTLTGAWTTATTGTAYLGANYLHDGNTGKGTKNVQFAPSLPATGHYWVYLRWPTTTGGAGGIPVDIKSLAGTHTVDVYQQSGSGPWFPLGEFDFAAGRNASTGSVTVRTTSTSGFVFADAVLFSPFPVSELHATFKLDLDFPSTLDLRNASATVVNTLAAPSFGTPPTAGVSVGQWPDRLAATPAAALTFRYFTTPTPGADNSMAPDPATVLSPSPEFVTPAGAALNGGVFYNTTVEVALRCLAAPDAFIFYTTNGAEPTDRSEIYSAPLSLTSTAIVRAVAIRPGGLPSRPITASFLFKESVLGTTAQGATPLDHQGALDSQNNFFGTLYGYPRFTGESRDASLGGGVYEFDYAMNGADIALYKNAMVTELSALPTISLVTPVNDGFNPEADGVFAHSSDSTLEVAGAVEFIGFSGQPHLRENCGIEIAGGSSRSEGQTPKHSLELQFRKSYSLTGDGKLTANLFPTIPFDQGRTVTKFDKLRLRTPLQNSWPIRGEGDSTFSGDPAESTYCNEQWGRDTQAGMGHLTPRTRWAHVYLNGIYWGVYALSEVVTQDFLSEHDKSRNNVSGEAALKFAENNYDVIGGGGRVLQGDPQAEYDWQNLRNETNYAVVEQQVDIDNYIDYLIANFFMVNRDWEDNDWRASRNLHPSAPDHKWRFYVWDCDGAFQQEYAGTAGLKNQHFDVASIHDNFRYYPPYQRKLTAHLKQHLLDTGGAFSPSGASFNSVIKYQTAMTAFQAGLYSESSRWGDVKLPAPRTTSFGFTDWQTNTSLVVNAFLPAQRTAFLSDAPDFGLLVSPSVNALNQGPEVTLTVPGGTTQPFSGGIAPLNSVLILSAPSKSIRYILDFEGSNRDPKSGGAASITSQKTWTLDQTLKDDYGSIEISARTLTNSVWSGLTRIQIEIQ